MSSQKSKVKPRWLRWTAIALFVLAAFLIMQALPFGRWIKSLEVWVESTGTWGPIIYGVIYVIAVIALAPGSVFTLVAGALFGIVRGTIVVSLASTTGAAMAFLIARHLARERVAKAAAENTKFKAMDEAIREGGWKIVAMLRLSPAVPFNLQNYLYGLTPIGFWQCVLTSWIAMLPGTLLYVYIGHIGAQAATTGGEDGGASFWRWFLLIFGLVITLVLTIYLTKIAKRKLAEQTRLEKEVNVQSAEQTTAGEDVGETVRKPMFSKDFVLLMASITALALGILAQMFSDTIGNMLATS